MQPIRQISPGAPWVDALHGYIQPYWDELLDGDWVEGIANTRLTVPEMKGWMLQMYPFIHAFPKFLAEALTNVEDEYSREFLIDNIRVEKTHAEHWIWMGNGFGLERQEMIDLAEGNKPILRDVQSLTDWLWHINTKGSLAEAIAATSFAIEGLAGHIAKKTANGLEAYRDMPGVEMKPKTYKWVREHALYDEDHPIVALEIVKRYALTESVQSKVMVAAKRSVQLLHNALMTSYQAYSVKGETAVFDDLSEKRTAKRRADRRNAAKATGFPERRFGERRGRMLRAVA